MELLLRHLQRKWLLVPVALWYRLCWIQLLHASMFLSDRTFVSCLVDLGGEGIYRAAVGALS